MKANSHIITAHSHYLGYLIIILFVQPKHDVHFVHIIQSMYKFIHLFQEFIMLAIVQQIYVLLQRYIVVILFLPETGDTSIERYPINPRTDTTMTFEALIRFP